MKVPIKGGVLLISMVLSVSAFAQKKVQQFTVSRVIKAPANKVWAVVGEDFGAIAKSHPGIISSEYIGGTLKGGEGTERVCNLNEKDPSTRMNGRWSTTRTSIALRPKSFMPMAFLWIRNIPTPSMMWIQSTQILPGCPSP